MSVSHHPNLPAIEDEGGLKGGSRMGPGNGSTTRLKRLSLLSKPLVLPSPPFNTAQESNGDQRTPLTAPIPIQRVPSSTSDEGTTGDAGPSTPMTATRKARDRNIGVGVRSSISYAYSPRTLSRVQEVGRRNGEKGSEGLEKVVGAGSGSNERGLMAPPSIPTMTGSSAEEGAARTNERSSQVEKQESKGVTLTEKHADLLTLIAHKERKVNELKLELAQQEQSLNQLKERWTTIVSRSTRPFTTRSPSSISSTSSSSTLPPLSAPRRSDKSRSRPITGSTPSIGPDPAITSLLDSANAADDISLVNAQNVLNNLIATAYGPEGVVTPSAVEGGKRFWGQLVKTVSAAAGGNVPDLSEDPAQEAVNDMAGEGGENKQGTKHTLDISTLKNIVSLPSWSTLTSPPLPSSTSSSSTSATFSTKTRSIPQPANISRLPQRNQYRGRETSTASVSSTTTSETNISAMLDTPNATREQYAARPRAQGDEKAPSSSEWNDLYDGSGANFQDLMNMEEPLEPRRSTNQPLQPPISVAPAGDLLLEPDDGVVDEDEWGL